MALGTLFATEFEIFHLTLATLTWIGLNLFFLSILRRPLMAAMLSLAVILTVIAVSRFKFEVTWMTVTFLDLLIIDSGTVAFLLKTFPNVRLALSGGLIADDPARDPDLAHGSVSRAARACRARRDGLSCADRRHCR